MRAKEFIINIPISITIPFNGNAEIEYDNSGTESSETPSTNVMVPPLQQKMELMKAAMGKDSPVIDQLISNDDPNSGLQNLVPKPQHNLKAYMQYPKFNSDSKDILFTKSGNFYTYNGFWDIVKDNNETIWQPSCTTFAKILNI